MAHDAPRNNPHRLGRKGGGVIGLGILLLMLRIPIFFLEGKEKQLKMAISLAVRRFGVGRRSRRSSAPAWGRGRCRNSCL